MNVYTTILFYTTISKSLRARVLYVCNTPPTTYIYYDISSSGKEPPYRRQYAAEDNDTSAVDR